MISTITIIYIYIYDLSSSCGESQCSSTSLQARAVEAPSVSSSTAQWTKVFFTFTEMFILLQHNVLCVLAKYFVLQQDESFCESNACQTSAAWATKPRPLMWHGCYSKPVRVLEQKDWVKYKKPLHKNSGHEYRTTSTNAQADFTPNNHAAAQLSASTPSQPARLPIAMWKLKTRNTNAICTTNNVTGSLTGPWGLRRRHVSAFQQSLCPATEFAQVITTKRIPGGVKAAKHGELTMKIV